MENDSGDRSNQAQDCENNDTGELSPLLVSLERHKNEEKTSWQESQSRVTKRQKKSRKRNVHTSGEDPDSSSTDSSSPAKKRKPNVSNVTNRHHQLTSTTDIIIFVNCQRLK